MKTMKEIASVLLMAVVVVACGQKKPKGFVELTDKVGIVPSSQMVEIPNSAAAAETGWSILKTYELSGNTLHIGGLEDFTAAVEAKQEEELIKSVSYSNGNKQIFLTRVGDNYHYDYLINAEGGQNGGFLRLIGSDSLRLVKAVENNYLKRFLKEL